MKPTKKIIRAVKGFALDAKGKFNGKPMAHWDSLADVLVMEQLLRAACVDATSIVGAIAAERIIGICMAVNPVLTEKMNPTAVAWFRRRSAAE